MHIQSLVIDHFRNLQPQTLAFHPCANIITGNNGEGKTNLLEAIHYLSLMRSFRTTRDLDLIPHDKDFLRIRASFENEDEQQTEISVHYSAGSKRNVRLNGIHIERPADYIGSVPTVALSPEQSAITFGGPQERRRFLDLSLSQAYPTYLVSLLTYRRQVKQRNKLLYNYKGNVPEELLQSWDEGLIQHGTYILERRIEFLKVIAEQTRDTFLHIAGGDSRLLLSYKNSFPLNGTVEDSFRRALTVKRYQEMERCTTLIGPHRDDIEFRLNHGSLKTNGSQGEHKLALFALKDAEISYIHNRIQRAPIMLFDDLFGFIDSGRSGKVVDFLRQRGQFFITTVDSQRIRDVLDSMSYPLQDVSYFRMEAGRLEPVN